MLRGSSACHDASLAEAPGSQAQASQAEVAEVQAGVKDHKMEIAEAVTSAFRDVNSSILGLSQTELQGHTTQLAMAPRWPSAVYDPATSFTWAFAGFNVLVSSFAPAGNRSADSMAQVTCSSLVENLSRTLARASYLARLREE